MVLPGAPERLNAEMLGKFESKNLKAMAWGENGFRHMTNNKRTVNTPDNLRA